MGYVNIELGSFLGESGDCAQQSMYLSGVFESPSWMNLFIVQTVAGHDCLNNV